MANSADPDQLASEKPTDLDLHCLQRQGISRFSRTKVKSMLQSLSEKLYKKLLTLIILYNAKCTNVEIFKLCFSNNANCRIVSFSSSI